MSSISKQLSSITFTSRKPSSSSEIRLVLLGRTGCGKSSTANSILGRKVFDTNASSSSVTQRCRRACGEVRGRCLTVLDTPGLLDTHQTPQEVQRELRRSVSLLYPGPHVFLIVIQIGRFTPEKKEVVRQIKQAMGSQALSFSVVVFTHGDLLEEGTSVQHTVIDGCRDLEGLVDACGGRHCVFNNQSKSKEQVSALFALVDSMVQGSGGSCYCSKMLQRADEELAQDLLEERRLLDEKGERLKKQLETTIKESHEKELEMVQQQYKREMEELTKKQELQREEEAKLARDREQAFRRGMEDIERRQKERTIQEQVRVMMIRREEEERREELQEKLNKVSKMLEEQAERAEAMRRAMEGKIQKDREEVEKKARERELQQIQKEQAIRQREEMRRDALQKELDKMEILLRREREENQRERDIEIENRRAEKRRILAIQQELKLVQMKNEQQKAGEENLKRQLQEHLRRERGRCDEEISLLKTQCDKRCSGVCCETIKKISAEGQGTLSAGMGYVQEMGLVALNAALESVGAPCCIQ